MNFFLHTPTTKSKVNLSHQEAILLLGSCFTENIGEKLLNSKFNVNINPFGIIYNPISIANSLTRIVNNQLYTEQELSEQHKKWFSFDHHGSFSSFNQQECLTKINNEITCAYQHLQETKTIVITLGTAWVYENIENKKLVANCHKIPAKNFTKRLLSVEEIVHHFSALANKLNKINFLFTVSPVRHVSDGLHENNISKSVLHLAIHQLTSQHKNCSYFAAYEMIIDELRDYRFYKEDMIHPTPQAINYVWEKFVDTYFANETKNLILKIDKILSATQHKPFNFDSEAHQKFISDQLSLIDELTKNHPFLNLEKEKNKIKHLK
ncbi:MAG: GSCFA domain-containing protein [Flavobacteriales bacterium]|nr:GSCFA domain-containing protein [Flavobacteriales bacterium]